MENIDFDLNTVFNEVIRRMQDEGVFTHEVYDDFIEEILEEKLNSGELDDDDDMNDYIENLRHRWPEAEASLESGHDPDVLEQE